MLTAGKANRWNAPGRKPFLNEVEDACEESIVEPEFEEITCKRKKQSGKQEQNLSGSPLTVVSHELSEKELTDLFGEGGRKRLPDQIYRKLEMHPARYAVFEHHIAVYAGKETTI